MKAKTRGRPVVNYWPGYVDALVNVVLNLLFMVAMFGITIAVFSSTPRNNKLATAETPPLSGAAGASDGGPFVGYADGGGFPSGDAFASGLERAQVGSVGQAGTVDDPPTGRLANPGDAGSGAPARGAGPAAPDVRSAATAAGDAITGSPADSFTVVDAWRRQSGPGVRIQRRRGRDGALLLSFDLAPGSQPLDVLGRAGFVAALRQELSAVGPGVSALRVWTATSTRDPASRRAAYLAVSALRNQLLALGVVEGRIEARLVEGAGSRAGGLTLYLAIQGDEGGGG